MSPPTSLAIDCYLVKSCGDIFLVMGINIGFTLEETSNIELLLQLNIRKGAQKRRIRMSKIPRRPSLESRKKRREGKWKEELGLNFFDPTSSMTYFMDVPDLSGATILFAKDGWLLMSRARTELACDLMAFWNNNLENNVPGLATAPYKSEIPSFLNFCCQFVNILIQLSLPKLWIKSLLMLDFGVLDTVT
ncbi:hypothetical protein HHK36_019824 [Tetracentron sinense]|uniref:Uncharacterized protein n=1 Tax=Tetracentron sinense TaxID=13715 RepID=A0A835DD44_TETSI|nr:hypothetical protein HHK36_019824 [Tetracentron sinense]